MVWLNEKDDKGQEYVELRLNAPKGERICLEFNPLKMSGEPDWNPMWEEWHCYASPLRIYKQDYEILLGYFNKIYPIKDAFNGTLEPAFDVCLSAFFTHTRKFVSNILLPLSTRFKSRSISSMILNQSLFPIQL